MKYTEDETTYKGEKFICTRNDIVRLIKMVKDRDTEVDRLHKYAVHKDGCGYIFNQGTQTGELSSECTCGLDSPIEMKLWCWECKSKHDPEKKCGENK